MDEVEGEAFCAAPLEGELGVLGDEAGLDQGAGATKDAEGEAAWCLTWLELHGCDGPAGCADDGGLSTVQELWGGDALFDA